MVTPRFYKIRLGKDRPACGLKLWRGFGYDPVTGDLLERTWTWRCELNGIPTEINDVFPWWGDAGAPEVPPDSQPISEIDYAFYAKDGEWARTYQPQDPAAQPRKRVDMNRIDPIKW